MRTVRCSGRLGGGGVFQHAMGQTPPPPPLWTEFLTQACENITFPQLLLRTLVTVGNNGHVTYKQTLIPISLEHC